MKRILLFALLAALLVAFLPAQGLADNEFYKKSLELKALADASFEEGDYDAAADYAAQAQEQAALSDRYVEKMLAKASADKSIQAAKDRLAWADSVQAQGNFPSEYALASAELEASYAAYGAEDYAAARERADAALIALAGVTEGLPWPAVYVVRLIPERRDCLWRIAEYPFIYNNPLKWPVIYEANKKTFRDPTNPNLIFPGQKLSIPSIRGETRKGTYDPSKKYEPFPKK